MSDVMDKLNLLLEQGYLVAFQNGYKGQYFITLNSTVGCLVKAFDKQFTGETLDDVLDKAVEFIKIR